MGVEAFTVDWPATRRADIVRKVADFGLPAAPAGESWSIGCDADFLAHLRDHWLNRFDWDKAVERLNRHPQFTATIDGLKLHYIHVRAEVESAPPLLLLHGWPSSPFEFFDIIDRLTHPSRHGGDPADAVDVIAPSLPGYGFSGKPVSIIGPRAIADIINRLMVETLGYTAYFPHGGDWGAVVCSWLAILHPDHVRSIHLGMIALPMPPQPVTEEEKDWLARFNRVQGELGGYSHLQGSKPQSLAWLAMGNPLGQAAWLAERYHDWSDLRHRRFDEVFDLDWLITAILVYVMNDAFASAAYLYQGLARESGGSVTTLDQGRRCEVPTAFTNRLSDPRIIPPPRARVEQAYNIVRWRDASEGGHFPAHEQPDAFVEDLVDWMRLARS